VQAALGLEALGHLGEWTASTVAHAHVLNEQLAGTGVDTPFVPPDRTHVFYQYAMYTKRRDAVVRRCIRSGIDVETLHVDVCTRLPLFRAAHAPTPGAEQAATAIQLPVYASLTLEDVGRVAAVVRDAVAAA